MSDPCLCDDSEDLVVIRRDPGRVRLRYIAKYCGQILEVPLRTEIGVGAAPNACLPVDPEDQIFGPRIGQTHMTSKGCSRGWPLEQYAQLELRAPAGPDRGQRPYPGPGGAGLGFADA